MNNTLLYLENFKALTSALVVPADGWWQGIPRAVSLVCLSTHSNTHLSEMWSMMPSLWVIVAGTVTLARSVNGKTSPSQWIHFKGCENPYACVGPLDTGTCHSGAASIQATSSSCCSTDPPCLSPWCSFCVYFCYRYTVITSRKHWDLGLLRTSQDVQLWAYNTSSESN